MMSELAVLGIAGSIAAIAYILVDGGPVSVLWQKHSEYFRKRFDFLFIDILPEKVAAIHMAVCGGALFLVIAYKTIVMALLLPILVLIPAYILQRKENKKREEISEQLAPWLTVLANSLKSSPNIADAFASSTALVQSPLREEIDLLVKEVRLGEHLDRAMHTSASRLQSPLYSSVMTTLLVARQSGGNLPKILDESSATLREMERLAGVVRTKTAEGKSQTFVLALLPFVMVAALQKVDPNLIPGLWGSVTGKMVLAAALLFWLGSVALARRIVQVDI